MNTEHSVINIIYSQVTLHDHMHNVCFVYFTHYGAAEGYQNLCRHQLALLIQHVHCIRQT